MDNGVDLGNYWGDYIGFGYYYISGIAESVDRFPRHAPGYENSVLSSMLLIGLPVISIISFAGIIYRLKIKPNRSAEKITTQ
ncbi:hypothetical protein E4H12_00680 [Candidatus Thorarchaeota archaeon]|nr:MAG: hypothetical protein E4H12_00680 [Candidatus Thorarchaeota archaeon]